MAQAWDAEIEVGSELATRLIAHQFQDLAGLPVAPFSSGWDNTAFLVDGAWVFRFPRRHIASLHAILDAAVGCRAASIATLVHGDLYVRHLIVGDDARLLGIIDWGDLHLGDRASDLAIVFTVLPPAARAHFFATYGVRNG